MTIDVTRARAKFKYCPASGSLTHIETGEEVGYLWTSDSGKQYRKVKVDGEIYRVSRLIFLIETGRWPNGQVDHADGNGLNNSWDNLRDVTDQVNHQNCRLYSSNKSGVPGVRWRESIKRWVAVIDIEGTRTHLGHFIEKENAINARRAAEVEHGFHVNHGSSRPL